VPALVRDDGSLGARLVLIGEAPGANEEATGRPFVGAAGFKLADWWRAAGLQRSDFYITNVYPYRPPGNDLSKVPPQEIAPWIDQLHDRLAALSDPWLLVPTGNTALRALVGKMGITKHRGSIYGYEDRQGRTIKVIPTIHPAAIFRTPQWERRSLRDWARVAEDSAFRELRLPEREHFTRPSMADVESYVHDADPCAPLAIDIETPGGQIGCVGFAQSAAFSITIPTTSAYWGGALPRAWDAIRALCGAPCAKVTQNGAFDAFWLADYDVHLANWQWDTLAMHHALDPTDSHSLAYMASVDTRQPFWKDMRDPKEGDDTGVSWAGAQETLWHYNGIDACVTWELADLYRRRLAEQDRLAFYFRHYQSLFEPIQGMMRQGLRLDEPARRRQYAHLMHRCIMLQQQLATIAGEPLHATTRNKKREAAGKLPGLSNTKIARFLYETLRLPKQTDRKTGSVTTKEVAVRRLMVRHAKVADLMTAGTAILDHRRTTKLMEYLDEGKLDDDGRFRCTFKFTTDTGRFASSKSPKGTGRNLQNIDRELRGVFLPEPGMVFVEADLSQAEDRIVKMLAAAITGNQSLRARARAMPWENDEHRRAASIVFKKPVTAVTKVERQIAKPIRHGVNYNEGALTISEVLSKDGLTFTPEECQKALDALHAADPDIRVWQADVRKTVMTHKCLVNSWGRMLTFDHERLDDDAYRRGYAFVPQSEVPDLVNQWGLIPVVAWLKSTGRKSVLHLQGHDSLLLSCPPDEVWDVMAFLRASLERPRTIGREPLVIPVEFKAGRTWAATVEWKKPPTRDEVEAAVRGLV
jgi:uracil-DNA glycosylase family 4